MAAQIVEQAAEIVDQAAEIAELRRQLEENERSVTKHYETSFSVDPDATRAATLLASLLSFRWFVMRLVARATTKCGSIDATRPPSLSPSSLVVERILRTMDARLDCGALEALEVKDMQGLSNTAAAAVVAGLASCKSLKWLGLYGCGSLTVLPALPALT